MQRFHFFVSVPIASRPVVLVASLDTLPLRKPPAVLQRPVWWLNVFSVDAVLVALSWQLAFSLPFCVRGPEWGEWVMLGLTVWIAYTTDRLLDARRLNLDKRHALRHRVHADFRRPIQTIWLLAILVDITLIGTLASPSQLRWGLGCLLMVLAYMTRIHRTALRVRIPKELLAGALFAFGVSLLAWSSDSPRDPLSLGLSVFLAGILFSTNCAAVAYWERREDSEQKFRSWIRDPAYARQILTWTLIVLCSAAVVLCWMELIPVELSACLSLSGLSLMAVLVISQRHCHSEKFDSHVVSVPDRWSMLADLSLAWPPLVVWAFGVVQG